MAAMKTVREHVIVRGARPSGRALLFLAAAVCGCLAGPEPLPPDEALERAHVQITRLIEDERGQTPDAILIEPPETPADPGIVAFWYPAHPVIAPALGTPEIRTAFETAHPDVQLKAQFIGEWHVAVQKLTVNLAAGDLPDIAVVERAWAARLARAGRILPLDGFLDPRVLDDLHPNARAAYTMQDRVWALPADGFCSVLFYNRAMTPHPPHTWDELRGLAPETQYAIGYVPYVEMLWSAGGRVCELNQSGLTAPPALRTLQFLLALRDAGRSNARMLEDPRWGFAAFLNGDAAMTVASSAWLARTRDAGFPVDMAPLPGENGPVSRLGDMAIVVFARHAAARRDGIVAVLDFLTGSAVQGAGAAARGSMPVRQSVAGTVDVPPGLRAAYAAAEAPPFIGAWSAAEYELASGLTRVWRWTNDGGKAGTAGR